MYTLKTCFESKIFLSCENDAMCDFYLAHVIEQPIFQIQNILFVYFFIDFFVKHIFLRHV